MTVTTQDRFRIRRGTAADLAEVNEVPLADEFVYESDEGLADGKYKIKIGDGITHYNDLPYIQLGGGIEDVIEGSHIAIDKTDPKNPVIGISGLTVSSSYAEGDEFPTSPAPALDDKFYRTDLNLLCYYDGTRWLTVQEYSLSPGGDNAASNGNNVTHVHAGRWALPMNAHIHRVELYSYQESGSTDTNYWTFSLTELNSGTVIATMNTKNDTLATAVGHSASADYDTSSTRCGFIGIADKTGSPGLVQFNAFIVYRLIVT